MSSSILLYSCFDPTSTIFASVVAALDLHRVRIQSLNSASSNELSIAFSLDKGLKVKSLGWCYASVDEKSHKKKKKLYNDIPKNFENLVLVIGLNKGGAILFSPVQGKTIAKLEITTSSSIINFHYSDLTKSGWTCDSNGQVLEWDFNKFSIKRTISLEDGNNEDIQFIQTAKVNGKILLFLVSHTIYLINPLEPDKILAKIPGHIAPIHTLLISSQDPDLFLTSAINDRFINVYSISKQKSVAILSAPSSILSISLGGSKGESVISAVTEDGTAELFFDPFDIEPQASGGSRKRRGQVQSRASQAQIKIIRPIINPTPKSQPEVVPIVKTNIDGEFIIVGWIENANVPLFDKVKYQVDSQNISGITSLEKERVIISKGLEKNTSGYDPAAARQYRDNNAVVTSGDNLQDLGILGEDDEEKYSDEEELEELEPTLGERVEELTLGESKQYKSKNTKKKNLKISAGTLTTVLSEALRANDHAFLETCLHHGNEDDVKKTVEQLDSILAVSLLNRLAEKAARSPNRVSHLYIWIKCTMVSHGGYLVTVPDLARSLTSLYSTMQRRSVTLPRLLKLQGKLGMLHSQIELRREIMSSYQRIGEETDDESDVEYFEELDGESDYNLSTSEEEEESDSDFDSDSEDGFISFEEDRDGDIEMNGDSGHNVSSLVDIEAEEEGYSDLDVNGGNKDLEDELPGSEEESSDEKLEELRRRIKDKKTKR